MAQTLTQTEIWQTLSDGKVTVSFLKNTPKEISCSGTNLIVTYWTTVQAITPKFDAFQREEEEGQNVIELKNVPRKEAKRLVTEYLKSHPGAWTSDIWYNLELEPDLVNSILSELRNEGKVEARPVD